MEDPVLLVGNKLDRVQTIVKDMVGALQHNKLTQAGAARLRGKLVFANSQTFGRLGALAFHYLGRRADQSGTTSRLSLELRWALEWWTLHMTDTKPRTVPLNHRQKPVYIFTDGSCEPDKDREHGIEAGYGAVMYDPEDGACEYFGAQCGDSLLGVLSRQGHKTQVVGQSELLPCLAARIIWAERLRNRLVINYIDNDAARFAMIKGSSPTKDSAWLAGATWDQEAKVGAFSWFERVPSPSNPSDGPSRGKAPVLEALGITAVKVEVPPDFESTLVQRWNKVASW
jgi:hypothetical protein